MIYNSDYNNRGYKYKDMIFLCNYSYPSNFYTSKTALSN